MANLSMNLINYLNHQTDITLQKAQETSEFSFNISPHQSRLKSHMLRQFILGNRGNRIIGLWFKACKQIKNLYKKDLTLNRRSLEVRTAKIVLSNKLKDSQSKEYQISKYWKEQKNKI